MSTYMKRLLGLTCLAWFVLVPTVTTTDSGRSVVPNGREAPRGTSIEVMMIFVKTVVNHIDTYTVASVSKKKELVLGNKSGSFCFTQRFQDTDRVTWDWICVG